MNIFGFFDGYKTKIAAVGLMLSGAGTIVAGLVDTAGVNWETVKTGGVLFMNGLGVFGIGHKIEKATE